MKDDFERKPITLRLMLDWISNHQQMKIEFHNPLTFMSDQDRISPHNINKISTR